MATTTTTTTAPPPSFRLEASSFFLSEFSPSGTTAGTVVIAGEPSGVVTFDELEDGGGFEISDKGEIISLQKFRHKDTEVVSVSVSAEDDEGQKAEISVDVFIGDENETVVEFQTHAPTPTTLNNKSEYKPATTTPIPDNHIYGSNTPNTPGGVPQHTFFGASVTSFSLSAGFGDEVSTLSVELVEDPANGDSFIQPIVGAPAFFTFGDVVRGTNTGFSKAIADLVGGSSSNDGFSFGGLVQSWNKTTDASAGQQYSVTLVDPREILQNVVLNLNNHAGTSHMSTNILNIYGYLEHVSTLYRSDFSNVNYLQKNFTMSPDIDFPNAYSKGRPVTGTGMSLRSDQGIPAFRVVQALNSLMGTHQFPVTTGSEYAQYGGYIKFRGYKYVVWMEGISVPFPKYNLNYDQMTLLELCMEFCEVNNQELYITLFPTNGGGRLDQFATAFGGADGVIVVGGINKQSASVAGTEAFVDSLPFYITNKQVGVELANATTDKFVTGARETEMKYFDCSKDKYPKFGGYGLEHSFNNQILPFYGVLTNNVATIPRYKGPFQQIVLDSRGCNAAGVGNHYVTTEIELRAADISFDKWLEFLTSYNYLYRETIWNKGILDICHTRVAWVAQVVAPTEITVPRCTHPPSTKDLSNWPTQRSHPPYGFPLYFGRAKAFGIACGSLGMNVGAGRVQENVDPAGDRANINLMPGKNKGVAGMNISHTNQQDAKAATSAILLREGLENAKVIYNFIKGVADEFLGKKFLIKVPQYPNAGYSPSLPFGFSPRTSAGAVSGGSNSWSEELKKAMLRTPLASSPRQKGALDIGYNVEKGEYQFNYMPVNAGGIDPEGVSLAPPALTNYFQEGGRTKCFVKLPEYVDIEGLDSSSYVYYKEASTRLYDGTEVEGKNYLFLKCDVEEYYVIAPPIVKGQVRSYGNSTLGEYPINPKSKSVADHIKGEYSTVEFPSPKSIAYPNPRVPDGGGIITYLDLDRTEQNDFPNYYSEGMNVYVVITMPTRLKAFRDDNQNWGAGSKNKITLANVSHYLREDMVIGMPGITNSESTSKTRFIVDDPDNNNFYEVVNDAFGAVRKACESLTFSICNRLKMIAPGPIYPISVGIPFESSERSYGPFYSSITDNGQVEQVHDEGLSPWAYGGYDLMNAAGWALAEPVVPSDLESERASFTMVGWPKGLTIGSLINGAGPIITSLSTTFDTDGIKTTVNLDSYTPSFGKLQKQKSDAISKMGRTRQQFRDVVNGLIRKNIFSNKHNWNFVDAQKVANRYVRSIRNESSRYTAIERGTAQPQNNLLMTYSGRRTVDKPVNKNFHQGDETYLRKDASLQSSEDTSEMSAMLATSGPHYYKQYWSTAGASMTDMFHPGSETWHNLLPCRGRYSERILYNDSLDNDFDISIYD